MAASSLPKPQDGSKRPRSDPGTGRKLDIVDSKGLLKPPQIINKEVSWLSFNARVLQEAADPTVPLIERLRFLGIFSSNLDEFFRVRVATLTRLMKLGRKAEEIIGHDPRLILKTIRRIVLQQNRTFDRVYRDILNRLKEERIVFVDENNLNPDQKESVMAAFRNDIRPRIFPVMLDRIRRFPDLKDRSIYLLVRLSHQKDSESEATALIEVPGEPLSRFIDLPSPGGGRTIILLDDVIRFGLPDIFSLFSHNRFEAYTVKLTRDAELDIDDDLSESLLKKVHKGLKQRKEGNPVRFVYDRDMPGDLLRRLVRELGLSRKKDTMVPGGRYHNFKDFLRFPPRDRTDLLYEKTEPLPLPRAPEERSLLKAVRNRDMLIHLPYQSFRSVIDVLREAALDPKVLSIKMTLYRLARDSGIVNALINAVRNGKSVTVVLEIQARFDEEANIGWADRLREEGVRVIYGVPGLKVHAKICLMTRREKGRDVHRTLIGTGNFNEDTARVYTDNILFTADSRIGREAYGLFIFFESNFKVVPFKQLLVSPFQMREKLVKLIRFEIEQAAAGHPAEIGMKLNNLTDPGIIAHLNKAARAGVKIRLIVRGMFSLIPSSRNIQAVRIVDKYLEHSRFIFFHHNGENLSFITSGDLMPRSLDRRVEVACPVFDRGLAREMRDVFEIQWRDNVKSRRLDVRRAKPSCRKGAEKPLRSQWEIVPYLKSRREADALPFQGERE